VRCPNLLHAGNAEFASANTLQPLNFANSRLFLCLPLMSFYDLSADPHQNPVNAHLPLANRQSTFYGVSIAFLVAAIIAVTLRLWVRSRDRLWGWDDVFVILACISSVAGDTVVCLMPGDGLGLHMWTLSGTRLTSYFRHTYMANTAYCVSATLVKLAVLSQFLRMFSEAGPSGVTAQYRLARKLTWVLIVLCSIWGLTFIMFAAFSCNPVSKFWMPQMRGRCIGWGTKDPDQFFKMFISHSATNSFLDILVLLLPTPFFRVMRLAGKSKAGLTLLYSLGCVITSCAIARIIALANHRLGTVPVFDLTYYTPLVYIFGLLEVNIALLAASIPIFWPLIVSLASKDILVVNEIEIHVESASRDSSLSAMGTKGDEVHDASSGRERTMTITTKSIDRQRSRSSHRRKPSEVSTLGKGFGHRPSQDSTRGFNLTKTNEHASSKSSLNNDDEGWSDELDRIHSAKRIVTAKGSHIPLEPMKSFH